MPMLSLEKISYKKPGSGGFCELLDGGEIICKVEEWAFSSCAPMAFFGMGANLKWWNTENIARLLKFLETARHHSVYLAKEVYVQLSSGQKRIICQDFLNHPNIKEIDSYMNKAHGPHSVHLFRISVAKDFK